MTRGTVLVVEDDPALCEVLRDELRDAGWSVHAFTSPLDALAQLDGRVPDVVLADYGLPEMRGDAFVQAIRARAPQVRLILMSGDDRAVRDRTSQDILVLPKPFGIDRVLEVLETAIGRNA